MEKTDLPILELELAYAVEEFVERSWPQEIWPTWPEYCAIYAEVRERFDAMLEAFEEWDSNRKASGAFTCDYCGKTHYHHAPPACCAAHRAESDDGSDG